MSCCSKLVEPKEGVLGWLLRSTGDSLDLWLASEVGIGAGSWGCHSLQVCCQNWAELKDTQLRLKNCLICGKPLLTWGQSWSEADKFYSGGDTAVGFHSDPNNRACKEMSICANSESVNVWMFLKSARLLWGAWQTASLQNDRMQDELGLLHAWGQQHYDRKQSGSGGWILLICLSS